MSSKELIALLVEDGWYHDRTRGSHQVFKHPTKSNHITVPHPKKDLPKGTAQKIMKEAGLR